MATEILNEMQNAVAGWRRVIGVVDTPADVADPGEHGVVQDRGPITVQFAGRRLRLPWRGHGAAGRRRQIAPRTRVAIVGETGSGKTTMAKLLTRLMDPTCRPRARSTASTCGTSASTRCVGGWSWCRRRGSSSTQTLADNIRFGRPTANEEDIALALTELGLDAWVSGLPHGLQTQVGQRGESLSAGERQLVAIARAYLADPDLLVLDEATSAVDPSTEVRIQRALEGLTRGRTSVAIAHRLSTAEAADTVIVVDRGQVVEQGSHGELVGRGGVYTRMYASWASQQRDRA